MQNSFTPRMMFEKIVSYNGEKIVLAQMDGKGLHGNSPYNPYIVVPGQIVRELSEKGRGTALVCNIPTDDQVEIEKIAHAEGLSGRVNFW